MKKFFYAIAAVAVLAVSACTQEELDKFLNKDIPCTSINFVEPPSQMFVGETKTLTVKLEPENTTDKVEWSSLMEDIATVNNGEVTAIKEGFVSIVAQAGKA